LSESELRAGAYADPARFGETFAKEAFAKAVGSGMRHPSPTRIGVTHDGLGKPVLQFDDDLFASGHQQPPCDQRRAGFLLRSLLEINWASLTPEENRAQSG
jgi:phosphopantetheinyl transferase (holo-ACP synthase)